MKKLNLILLSLLIIVPPCFAEFVISPSVGFSNVSIIGTVPLKTYLDLKDDDNLYPKDIKLQRELSWTPLTFGLDLRYATKSGILIGFDNYFSTIGNMTFKSDLKNAPSILKLHTDYNARAEKVGGFFGEGNLIGGFSFRDIPNLRINLAAGLGAGVGKLHTIIGYSEPVSRPELSTDLLLISVGIPVRLDLQYFFVKYAGLQISFADSPSFGLSVIEDGKNLTELYSSIPGSKAKEDRTAAIGFANILRITIGPVFKL